MSLAPRIIAAACLLAVPALLAVGSQALSRPAEVPLVDTQTVEVDLAPAGAADGGATRDTATDAPAPPRPDDVPGAPPSTPAPAPPAAPAPAPPAAPAPAPAPAPPAPPAGQGTPGLVEREVLGDDMDDDGTDGADDDAAAPDGDD